MSHVWALPDVLQQLGVPLLLALQARQLLQEMDPQLLGELHLRDGPAQPRGPGRDGVRGCAAPPARAPIPTAPRSWVPPKRGLASSAP